MVLTPFSSDPVFLLDFQRPLINRLLVRPEKVGLDGFNLCFETWADSRVYDAAATWIAFSE